MLVPCAMCQQSSTCSCVVLSLSASVMLGKKRRNGGERVSAFHLSCLESRVRLYSFIYCFWGRLWVGRNGNISLILFFDVFVHYGGGANYF